MTAAELWNEFTSIHPTDAHYEAWAFGCEPDKLAQLVLDGIKAATASAFALYALDPDEPMPKVGDYSIILSSRDEALCIIRTTRLETVPFRDVGAHQAWLEGEGDRSLAYWRQVHTEFFRQEYADYGLVFSEDAPILCEEFEVVYRASEAQMATAP